MIMDAGLKGGIVAKNVSQDGLAVSGNKVQHNFLFAFVGLRDYNSFECAAHISRSKIWTSLSLVEW